VLDVRLDTSEQEGTEDLVQLLDDGVRVRLVLGLEPGVKVLATSLVRATRQKLTLRRRRRGE
jgi:hypothetical protein